MSSTRPRRRPPAPEVLFVWEQRRQDLADILAADPGRLRWVQFRRVGIPGSTLDLFRAFPRVQLTNGSGASGIAVAEHALATLLALYKGLPRLYDAQRQHTWLEFPAAELHGQTACIIGLGDIGRSIARLLRPFGVRLLGVRRTPRAVPEVDETHTVDALGALLERSSIVILAAPLTPASQHLLGEPELQRLPAGAYLINVGRAGVVDTAALTRALQTGHLAGAGLDVFDAEPLAADSPLWSLPNVIVTPHSSAHTQPTDDRSVQLFLDNLDRFRRGEPLHSRLDLGLGY